MDIEKLQKLSALELKEESLAKVSKSLDGIIAMMSQVDSLDIETLKSSIERTKPLDSTVELSVPVSEPSPAPSALPPLLIDKTSIEVQAQLPLEGGLFLAPKAIKK